MKRLCKDWSVMQLPEEYHPIFFKPIIDEKGHTVMIVEDILGKPLYLFQTVRSQKTSGYLR